MLDTGNQFTWVPVAPNCHIMDSSMQTAKPTQERENICGQPTLTYTAAIFVLRGVSL